MGGAATGFGDVFTGADTFGLLTGARWTVAGGGGGGGVTARCVGAEEPLLAGAGLFETLATWLDDDDGAERRAVLERLAGLRAAGLAAGLETVAARWEDCSGGEGRVPNKPIDGMPIEPPTVSVCDSTATSARQQPAAAIVVAALVPKSCARVRRVMRR